MITWELADCHASAATLAAAFVAGNSFTMESANCRTEVDFAACPLVRCALAVAPVGVAGSAAAKGPRLALLEGGFSTGGSVDGIPGALPAVASGSSTLPCVVWLEAAQVCGRCQRACKVPLCGTRGVLRFETQSCGKQRNISHMRK